jgi:hypothetical protein
MFAVLAVQFAVDQVVDMALVWDGDVFAADPMDVVVRVPLVPAARVTGTHVARVELMFVDVAVVRVVQMAVVRVVHVVAVPHGHVAAAGSVDVLVLVVNERFHCAFSGCNGSTGPVRRQRRSIVPSTICNVTRPNT